MEKFETIEIEGHRYLITFASDDMYCVERDDVLYIVIVKRESGRLDVLRDEQAGNDRKLKKVGQFLSGFEAIRDNQKLLKNIIKSCTR